VNDASSSGKPEKILASAAAYAGCVSGAWLKEDYLKAIREAGFAEVEVLAESHYPIGSSNPDATELAIIEGGFTPEEVRYAANSVVSVKVYALKP